MRGSSLALGTAALAVVCCAGLPLLIAAVGGLTLGAVLGLAGLAVALGLIALLLVIRARRRACSPRTPEVRKVKVEPR
jgi:hypothetical protein